MAISNPHRMLVSNGGIARTQSMGANSQIVTIAFESYLMHMCVCCCLPGLAQVYLYSNSANALDFGYSRQ